VILLAIETSTPNYSVAVSTAETTIVRTATRTDPDYDGIAGLVAMTLSAAAIPAAALEGVVVDRGPGNLISVRSGLAFANGLAYAAKLPIYAANSLEALAQEAILTANSSFPINTTPINTTPINATPILATRAARKLTSDLVYAGVFGCEGTRKMTLGRIGDIAKEICDSYSELYVAGTHRDIGELAGMAVTDTGVERPTAKALLALALSGKLVPQSGAIAPLTEESEEFRA
jgi:tRNA threonylcarbamoyladenosine biosynthesis protein TsaB